MTEKILFGGITTLKGIRFIGKNHTIFINKKTGNTELKKEKRIERWYNKVPFIRGYAVLFSVFKFQWKKLLKVFLGIYGVSFLLLLFISFFVDLELTISVVGVNITVMSFVIYIILFLVYIGLIIFLLLIRNRHGLEHKILGVYNTGKKLTNENIIKQSADNKRCGSNLLALMFMITIVGKIFNMNGGWISLIAVSLGYELFLISTKNNFLSNIFYVPGYILQLLTVGRKQTVDDIKLYLLGFKKLLKVEEAHT